MSPSAETLIDRGTIFLRCGICCARHGLVETDLCGNCGPASGLPACMRCARTAMSVPGTFATHPQRHTVAGARDLCVDEGVAELVTLLNESGLTTADSCQGDPGCDGTISFVRAADAERVLRAWSQASSEVWLRATLRCLRAESGEVYSYCDVLVPSGAWGAVHDTVRAELRDR